MEWTSLKGRGPRKFAVRKTTCSTKTPHVCVTPFEWVFTRSRKHVVKQAQDPLGSLHTRISPVEWSSLKGRGPRWFTVRKTTCFHKDTTYLCHRFWQSEFTHIRFWSELPSKGRGPRWFAVRQTTCFTETPHVLCCWASGVVKKKSSVCQRNVPCLKAKRPPELEEVPLEGYLNYTKPYNIHNIFDKGPTRGIFELHKAPQYSQYISFWLSQSKLLLGNPAFFRVSEFVCFFLIAEYRCCSGFMSVSRIAEYNLHYPFLF